MSILQQSKIKKKIVLFIHTFFSYVIVESLHLLTLKQ